jgi:hypothetical protein
LTFIGSLSPGRGNGRRQRRQCTGFIARPLDFATRSRQQITRAEMHRTTVVDRQGGMAAVCRCGFRSRKRLSNNNRSPFFGHADGVRDILTQHIPSTGSLSFLPVDLEMRSNGVGNTRAWPTLVFASWCHRAPLTRRHH